jgi:hypothetical protein
LFPESVLPSAGAIARFMLRTDKQSAGAALEDALVGAIRRKSRSHS